SWAHEVESSVNDPSGPPQRPATPPSQAIQTPITPDNSPLVLRQESPVATNQGLAASRHNPLRPQTPVEESAEKRPEEVHTPENFVPRDVSDTPWHMRNNSTPLSLVSQSTLSSAPSSPIHAALPIDNHEPVIRDSWPTPIRGDLFTGHLFTGRPRNDSQVTDYSPYNHDNAPTNTKSPSNHFAQWQRQEAAGATSSVSNESVGSQGSGGSAESNDSPVTAGSLFQRMRNIFEQSQSPSQANGSSPVRSRPSSGLFYQTRKGSLAMKEPGSVNDAEEGVDEHSTLLRS
ncbi:hypothetical protein QBC46DRAFT_236677, partial [Diplogelasinospora grovesii]